MSSTGTSFPQRDDAAAASTAEAKRQREILEKAKARSRGNASERPGSLQNVPRFDEVHAAGKTMKPAPGASSPPPALSRGTVDALAAVAAANAANAASTPGEEDQESLPAPPATDLNVDEIADLFGVQKDVAREIYKLAHPEDPKPGARERIEKRLSPIDIGEFLMNGSVTQAVPIIPASDTVRGGLTITYQTVTDAVEASVDRLLSEEAAKIRKVRDGEAYVDVEMSQREYVRRQNEYALAVHVAQYGPTKWPSIVLTGGAVDEAAILARMQKVRQIPSPVFGMAIENLSWFLQRVQKLLEVAVLGNG